MTGYLFKVDTSGKIIAGQALEGWVNGDINVWNAQERSFYDAITGKWTIYERIQITAPATTSVNTAITATATLPANSPDTAIQFRVAWQDVDGVWHRTDPVNVAVVDGQASKDFQFTAPGKYLIEALSEHHGLASAEVMVS